VHPLRNGRSPRHDQMRVLFGAEGDRWIDARQNSTAPRCITSRTIAPRARPKPDAPALTYGVGDHTIDADARERDRDERERRKHRRLQPALRERAIDDRRQGSRVVHRLLRVHRLDRAGERAADTPDRCACPRSASCGPASAARTEVDPRTRVLIDEVVSDVADDADVRHPVVIAWNRDADAASDLNGAAERPREALVVA